MGARFSLDFNFVFKKWSSSWSKETNIKRFNWTLFDIYGMYENLTILSEDFHIYLSTFQQLIRISVTVATGRAEPSRRPFPRQLPPAFCHIKSLRNLSNECEFCNESTAIKVWFYSALENQFGLQPGRQLKCKALKCLLKSIRVSGIDHNIWPVSKPPPLAKPILKVTATTTCTHISRTLTSPGLWPV